MPSSDGREIRINAAVEGLSDEGAVEAVLNEVGLSVENWFGRRGKSHLLKKIGNYNEAARHQPWFALIDLDDDFTCAGAARSAWLPDPVEAMCFRIAVPETEAWLLADAEAVAAFLGVSASKIPTHPEKLKDPKQELVNLARKSRRRVIREGLVPVPGSGANVGPTYASDLRNFAKEAWRPRVASQRAPSLDRCLTRAVELRTAAAD